VQVTVTDDRGATATAAGSVTVSPIALTATGRRRKGFAYVDLSWRGATGASVAVYRNDVRRATVANDGAHTDDTGRKGSPTFAYRICEIGSGICSSSVTVRF
jgi:thermitase